jgi:ubiquinone/menaquinone biosynthesis C-methylase UbiE
MNSSRVYCLSTDKIHNKVIELLQANITESSEVNHLDIGSGTGDLIKLIQSNLPSVKSEAVDYTDELMQNSTVKVSITDLNVDTLPFQDNEFDVITCTEVLEHLENFRLILRESFRTLKPGGLAIFTTPNVLNLNSRLRYFNFGFHTLFGPLKVNREEAFSTGGHITPVQYFYLAHSLLEAGFTDIELTFDKKQTSAIPWMILCYPIIFIASYFGYKRQKRKGDINPSNKDIVSPINSLDMLLGRTIIVKAKKTK